MHRQRLLTGFINLLLPFLAVAAIPESYIFTHYGSNIGMPAVIVNDISQTGEGRVWLATYSGLYSYDGRELNNYKAVDTEDVSLQVYNRYTQVESDVYSNLWLLSQSNSLFYYNQKKGNFELLSQNIEKIYRISSSEFYFITKDKQVLRNSYSSEHAPSLQDFFTLPSETEVNGIVKADDIIWTLTDDGLYKNTQMISSAEVFCYERYGDDLYFGSSKGVVLQYQEGRLKSINTYCNDNVTFLMVLDNKVDVIIGTESAKLYSINTGSWQLSEVKGSYYSPTGYFKSLRIAGDLYLYAENGGLYSYDQTTNSVHPFYDAQSQRIWDSEVNVHSVFADRQNNIWLSSSLGGMTKAVKKIDGFFLHKLVADPDRFFQNSVTALYQDDDAYIYVGTRDGKIHILDAGKREIAQWDVESVPSSIKKTETGALYMTTMRDGVVENLSRNPLSLTPKTYKASRDFWSLTSNDFLYLAANDSSRIWFASRDDGLCYLDVSSGHFITKKNRMSFPTEDVNCIRHLLFGQDGWLYASGSLGLFVCRNPDDDPENMKFERFQSVVDYDINHILITSDGKLYGSSLGGGFLAFESAETDSKVRAYTVDDGMLSDRVLSAIEDDEGIIWIATTGGLNKFNPATGSITPYTRESINIRTSFHFGSPVKLVDGDICFPARGGVFYFNPQNIQTSKDVPEILIKDCFISGTSVDVDPAKPLRFKAKSSLRLDFYAIDQSAPDRIFYYYKMDGLDDDWRLLGRNGEINIEKMPRGHYDLRLRSTNGDGVSVSNELVIDIHSVSVFWNIVNAMFVLLTICVVIVVYRMVRLKKEFKNPEDEKFKATLLDFLDKNIDNAELNALDIAAAMNISRSALFDKAGHILGKAPMELLRERRIQKAAELLKSPEYTISQIAYMCGFSDSHYFSRAFKKHYGQSPSSFRKQQLPPL